MAVTTPRPRQDRTASENGTAAVAAHAHLRDPRYQAFWLLRVAFTVAPIAFGVDKFFNVLVNWEGYLAPWIRDASPLSATHTMYVVGVIEILAGVLVALKPRYAAYVVAAWL